jgi:hypothetical protein
MKENYIMKIRKIVFTTALSALVCFGLLAGAYAQGPEAPDTALAGGNTADGHLALGALTTGIYNSAFGIFALLSDGAANFNTGVGAGVLLSSNSSAANTANENTAVGAGALFSNIDADSNTAVGAFALFNENATGGFPNGVSNNAIGREAMFSNISGSFNEAIGVNALFSNTTGGGNIAIGDDAGAIITGNGNVTIGTGSFATGITSGSNNTVVGDGSGLGITSSSGCVILGTGAGPNASNLGNNCIYIGGGETSPGFENNTIRIGDANAASPATACFIGGILSNVVPPSIGNTIVTIDPTTGQLGATTDAAANKVAEQQKKIEEQQASISQLKSEMQTMVAQLKEQAAQIQKVSAQLEVKKPAPQVVANK